MSFFGSSCTPRIAYWLFLFRLITALLSRTLRNDIKQTSTHDLISRLVLIPKIQPITTYNKLLSMYKRNLDNLKQKPTLVWEDVFNELVVINRLFYYAPIMQVDVQNSIFYYKQNVLQKVGQYYDAITQPNATMHFQTTNLPNTTVSYNYVAVIQYRGEYNIFHFMEGTNYFLRFLLDKDYRLPIKYIYLSHYYEENTFSNWYGDYLKCVLDIIPQNERPIILTRSYLLKKHTRIEFKNVILFYGSRQSIIFWSYGEYSFLLRHVYKRYSLPLVKTSPLQITYLSRKNTYRHVTNEEELLACIRQFNQTVAFTTFTNMTFESQVRLIAQTDIFIGIHGAGLVNSAFLRPKSTVIEIKNPHFLHNHYFDLNTVIKTNYILFTQVKKAKWVSIQERNKWWNPEVNYDLIVDLNEFHKVLSFCILNYYSK